MSTLLEFLNQKGLIIDRLELIEEAFTHTSFVNEHKDVQHDNERLELLGDAVLQLYVSDLLYHYIPSLSEGEMTSLRSRLVNEKTLASITRRCDLFNFLRLGVGEEKTGGRNRDSLLADVFEAFVAALYLQKDRGNVKRFLDPLIIPEFKAMLKQEHDDYKTRLQEYVQSDTRKTVVYEVIKSVGPSNAPTFEVVVKLDELILGKGKGSSKKQAEQNAAKDAFSKLVR
jgi:ribonuclease III